MDGIEKLKQDLVYVQAMVKELTNYLYSEVVYWPSLGGGVPDLTLGGFLMRVRRLEMLSYLISEAEQQTLMQTVTEFKDLTSDLAATLEQKATLELEIRIKQWEQNLSDYWDAETIEKEYYKTDVQVRTIITDLLVMLALPQNQRDQELVLRLAALDDRLQAAWQIGDFIWPEEWIPAYRRNEYWFLYGYPAVHSG
ncbi:MAG: hypothetical protein ACK2UW_00165 [Anaerolineales bacterium]